MSLVASTTAFAQVVTKTADDGTAGTLRDAINQRNLCTSACSAITFNIPGIDTGCTATQCVIRLDATLGALPELDSSATEAYTIDGSTQPGALGIVIDGSGISTGNGLVVRDPSTTIQKIAVVNFPGAGVLVEPSGFSIPNSFQILASSIGADWDGVASGNGGTGILVTVPDLFDGGISPGLVNQTLVANNASTGIHLDGAVNDIEMTDLSVFDNGGLGIDLDPLGPTLNDPDDADFGPNDLLNFPVIDSALPGSSVGLRVISGSLDLSSFDAAFAPVKIQVYGSPAPDGSGYGEGQQLLATIAATADGNGDVTAWSTGEISVPAGLYSFTATATLDDFCSGTRTTSEFSLALTIPAAAADAYTATEDVALTVAAPGVLANDSDADNSPSPLTAAVVTGPTNGTLTLNA
ncbi:MAG TPA: Ig-like domain-containing protein, partial [Thermoanaerobaculia bacterium]|nr:Ig-like domain-containing protein [Thermoanaerobaculia bacterium]